MSKELEALARERDEYRRKLAFAEWRYQSLRARKWWRLGLEIRWALRRPWRFFVLPVRLLKVLAGRSVTVPKPNSGGGKSAGRRSGDDALEQAAHNFEAGNYRRSLEILEEILAQKPRSVRALDLKRRVETRLGEVSAALGTVRRTLQFSGAPKYRHAERLLEGRLQELTPGWLPAVPGPPPVDYRPRSAETVLHVLKASVPFAVTGSTMRSLYMVASQRALGLDPIVSTTIGFPRDRGIEEFPAVETIHGVRYHRIDPGPGYDLESVPVDEQLETWAWLAARVVEAERPAILHAGSGHRGYENALVSLALGRHFGLPVVYEVRSFHEATWTRDVNIAEAGELYRRRLEVENFCMGQADAVVTLAETMKSELAERGIPTAKIAVIGNAVDPERFQPQPAPVDLLRQMGFQNRTVVGYISNLSRREGVDVLLRAVAANIGEGLAVSCLIVGDGPERPGLEELAHTLGIAEHVVFTGEVPHEAIRDYYAAIDVFVVPRRDDRAARLVTPLKPFEAMAMARPVIVSALPALVEVVPPDERGVAFEAEDPVALAAQIKRLVEHPDYARELGERGRQWVTRNRTWRGNAERYRELYRTLTVATDQPATVDALLTGHNGE